MAKHKRSKIKHALLLATLTPERTAFLGLVAKNYRGFAARIERQKGEDMTNLYNKWYNLGGSDNALKKAVAKGHKHEPMNIPPINKSGSNNADGSPLIEGYTVFLHSQPLEAAGGRSTKDTKSVDGWDEAPAQHANISWGKADGSKEIVDGVAYIGANSCAPAMNADGEFMNQNGDSADNSAPSADVPAVSAGSTTADVVKTATTPTTGNTVQDVGGLVKVADEIIASLTGLLAKPTTKEAGSTPNDLGALSAADQKKAVDKAANRDKKSNSGQTAVIVIVGIGLVVGGYALYKRFKKNS